MNHGLEAQTVESIGTTNVHNTPLKIDLDIKTRMPRCMNPQPCILIFITSATWREDMAASICLGSHTDP